MAKAKPFNIRKREVWEAFKKVKANQGAAGVDGQTIAEFEADLFQQPPTGYWRSHVLRELLSSAGAAELDLPKGDGRTWPLSIQQSATESHRKSSNGIWSRSWSPSSTMTPMDTAPADRRSTPSRRPDSVAGDSTSGARY